MKFKFEFLIKILFNLTNIFILNKYNLNRYMHLISKRAIQNVSKHLHSLPIDKCKKFLLFTSILLKRILYINRKFELKALPWKWNWNIPIPLNQHIYIENQKKINFKHTSGEKFIFSKIYSREFERRHLS